MTFDEWLEQASETDLRDASEFVHHYPVEISVMEIDMSEIDTSDKTTVEAALAKLKSPKEWPTKTVCGCDPAFQHEFGSEGHRPRDWEDLSESTFSMDELTKWLEQDTTD